MKQILPILCLIGASVLAQDDDLGKRRALLVGINEYQSPMIKDLGGCVNDVLALKSVLETKLGYDEVTVLVDGQATRKGILDALKELVAVSREGDSLFFHYSGHGAYVEDFSGDESDGTDETLIPHDARTEGVRDIVDDELGQYLGKLKTSRAFVSFDSCHSGTVTRGASRVVTRAIKPDPRAELYRHVKHRAAGGELDYVFMSSATEKEEALDAQIDGVRHGVFSRAFLDVLSECSPRLTAKEQFEAIVARYQRITARIGEAHRATTPQLEGDARLLEVPLLPVVAEARMPRRPWLETRGAGTKIRILGAKAAAAGVGSSWAVYAEGDQQFAPGDALAAGKVIGFRGQDAILELVRLTSERRDFNGCRAIEMGKAPPRRLVELKLGVDRATGIEIEQHLDRAKTLVEVVANNAEVAADLLVQRAEAGFAVFGADGQSIVARAADAAAVAGAVSRTVISNELMALENPASMIQIRIGAVGRAGVEQSATPRSVKLSGVGAGARRFFVCRDEGNPRADEMIELELEAEQDVYVTLVAIDTEGRVQLLVPNDDLVVSAELPAFARVRVPGRMVDGRRARWLLQTPGDQTFRAFATADFETASFLRDAIARIDAIQAGSRAGNATPEVLAVIDRLRERLLSVATRRVELKGIGKKRKRMRPASSPRPQPAQDQGELADNENELADNENEFADSDVFEGIDATAEAPLGDWNVATFTIRVENR